MVCLSLMSWWLQNKKLLEADRTIHYWGGYLPYYHVNDLEFIQLNEWLFWLNMSNWVRMLPHPSPSTPPPIRLWNSDAFLLILQTLAKLEVWPRSFDKLSLIVFQCSHERSSLKSWCFFFFCFSVKKDVPPSAVTRPIYGILGTIRLVAGKEGRTMLFKNT